MSYERDNILAMSGYQYGEQPEDADVIKLNTNENPYPPSPRVAEALRAFDVDSLRRYPSAPSNQFRNLVAERFGITAEQVMVTNGGDEALRLAITTFVDPEATFGTTDPSYSLYEVLAQVQNCKIETVALDENWNIPRDFAAHLNDKGTRLTCIVNPHAPSGHLMNVDAIGRLAQELHGVLLVDEAYVDFVDPSLRHDATTLIHGFDNILLLRTLSKGYSLAGLRFGFLMGPVSLIDPMQKKTRDSYNVGAISQQLACASFADEAYARETWDQVRRDRRELRERLTELGFTVPISQSNFLLVEVPLESTASARALYEGLKRESILVRYFDHPNMEDRLRISVGTPAENAALITMLRQLL